MNPRLAFCAPDLPLAAVARVMAENELRSVVVADDLDANPSAWGIIRALDLVAAEIVRNLGSQLAAGSAAKPVVTVSSGETLGRAAHLMVEHAIAELIVVDGSSNHPIGVLSTLDLVNALARRPPLNLRLRARRSGFDESIVQRVAHQICARAGRASA